MQRVELFEEVAGFGDDDGASLFVFCFGEGFFEVVGCLFHSAGGGFGIGYGGEDFSDTFGVATAEHVTAVLDAGGGVDGVVLFDVVDVCHEFTEVFDSFAWLVVFK